MGRIIFTGNSTFSLKNFRLNFILKLKEIGCEVFAITPKDKDDLSLANCGINHQSIFLSQKSMNPLFEIITILHLLTRILTIQPNAVFAYTIKNCIYSGLCRYIVSFSFYPTITGLGSAINGKTLFHNMIISLLKLSLKKADKVFCQNKEIVNFLERHQICQRDDCILVAGSGVDLDKFAFHPMPTSSKIVEFVYVGRLLKKKGIHHFIDAAKLAKRLGLRANFTIIGSNSSADPDCYFEQMKRLISNLDNVQYLGFMDDIYPILKRSHCVVLPSDYNEGVPRCLLEGASVGRLIVTTNRPGCREVVEEGYNGFLLHETNSENLIEIMRKIINLDHSQLSFLGQNSRKLAENKFDERLVIRKYLSVLGHESK